MNLKIKVFGPPNLLDSLKEYISIVLFGQTMHILGEVDAKVDIYIGRPGLKEAHFRRGFYQMNNKFYQGAKEYSNKKIFSEVSIAGIKLLTRPQPGWDTEYEIVLS